jgi:hypothetical protein
MVSNPFLVWIFSFGIFCIMGGVYYLLQDSVGFDNLMHGKSPKGNQKQRSLEDFGKFDGSSLLDDITNGVSQLSHSSVCRPNTRSRNKCEVFGVWGAKGENSWVLVTVHRRLFLTFPCPKYCNMALTGEM